MIISIGRDYKRLREELFCFLFPFCPFSLFLYSHLVEIDLDNGQNRSLRFYICCMIISIGREIVKDWERSYFVVFSPFLCSQLVEIDFNIGENWFLRFYICCMITDYFHWKRLQKIERGVVLFSSSLFLS